MAILSQRTIAMNIQRSNIPSTNSVPREPRFVGLGPDEGKVEQKEKMRA